MNMKYPNLEKIFKKNIISQEQFDKGVEYLDSISAEEEGAVETSEVSGKMINFIDILYYIGGFMVLFAVVFFISQFWADIGETGKVLISSMFSLASGLLAFWFTTRDNKVPAGIMFLVSIATFGLLGYTFFDLLGWWPEQESVGLITEQLTSNDWRIISLLSFVIVVGMALYSLVTYYLYKIGVLLVPLILNVFWSINLLISMVLGRELFSEMTLVVWVGLIYGLVLLTISEIARNLISEGKAWVINFGFFWLFCAIIYFRFNWDFGGSNFLVYAFMLVSSFAAFVLSNIRQDRSYLVWGAIVFFWLFNDVVWTYLSETLGAFFAVVFSGLGVMLFAYVLQSGIISKNFRFVSKSKGN